MRRLTSWCVMRDCVPDKGYSMNRLHKTSAVAAIAAVTISLLTALISTHATAQQKFPAKPIRIIVAFTAGGTPDTLARAQALGLKAAEYLDALIVEMDLTIGENGETVFGGLLAQ